MSLSNSQLSQLDRELDHNQREMVVMPMDDFGAQSVGFDTSSSTTQALKYVAELRRTC
nr:hypothetical protein [Pseudomonas sp. Hg5Tf]MDH2558332.1 hypothetical protein [Pseudomonas sp. Hg5Tf]